LLSSENLLAGTMMGREIVEAELAESVRVREEGELPPSLPLELLVKEGRVASGKATFSS
jgi:hypothetical protein